MATRSTEHSSGNWSRNSFLDGDEISWNEVETKVRTGATLRLVYKVCGVWFTSFCAKTRCALVPLINEAQEKHRCGVSPFGVPERHSPRWHGLVIVAGSVLRLSVH